MEKLKFMCLLEIQLHKQMSAKSLPVHWLCLWSNTEHFLHPPLEPTWCLCSWTSTCCMWAISLGPQLPIFDELNSSQALLTLFTRPWGKIFCPALFFPDPKMMLRAQTTRVFWRGFPWCERLQNHLGLVLSSLLTQRDGSGQETKRS